MSATTQFLLPGEFVIATEPMVLDTLLGSCVSVTLFNKATSHAAMNHVVVPSGGNHLGKSADTATEHIISELFRRDAVPGHYTASVLGGADMYDSDMRIGRRNVATARTMLEAAGIRYDASQVHGRRGRRMSFDTSTGELTVRTVPGTRDSNGNGIRVLIVDGSEDTRRVLNDGLGRTPGITVVGQAGNPFEAREQIVATHPDVVTMSVEMEKMDGLDFLERLMHSYPLPVVVVSWLVRPGSGAARRAIGLGAAAVVNKDELRLFDGGDTAARVLTPILEQAVAGDRPRARLL